METTTFCICPGEAKVWWRSCEISKDLQGSETHTRNCAFSTQNGGPVQQHHNLPQARGNVHTLVQLVYLTDRTDTPMNAQGVPSRPRVPVLLKVGRGSGRGSAAQQHTQSALAELTQMAV